MEPYFPEEEEQAKLYHFISNYKQILNKICLVGKKVVSPHCLCCSCGFDVEGKEAVDQAGIQHIEQCPLLDEYYIQEKRDFKKIIHDNKKIVSWKEKANLLNYLKVLLNQEMRKLEDQFGELLGGQVNDEIQAENNEIHRPVQEIQPEAENLVNEHPVVEVPVENLGEQEPIVEENENKEEQITIVQPRNPEPEELPKELSAEEVNALLRVGEERVKSDYKERCGYCNKDLASNDQVNSDVIGFFSTSCNHQVHKTCFEVASFQQVLTDQLDYRAWKLSKEMQCPQCFNPIAESEVKQILQQEVEQDMIQMPIFNRITSEENRVKLKEFLETLNIVTCSCGNMMELVEGIIEPNLKDNFGRPLNEEALVHFAKNRVRCYQCQKNFCSLCKIEPYHLGYTCEGYRNMQDALKCRFCQQKLSEPSQSENPAFINVCRNIDCIQLMEKSCTKIQECGHACCGFKDEEKCLPCLEPECVKQKPDETLQINMEEFCTICYTESLGQQPCVQFACKHIFHLDCMISKLKLRWNAPRINFAFLNCPSCNQKIDASHCPMVNEVLQDGYRLLDLVKQKALERAKHEGLDKDERLNNPEDPFHNNLQEFAMFKLSFYECFRCKLPFYGGMRDCGEEANQQQNQNNLYNPEDLVCGLCASIGLGAGVQNCEKHGEDYIEFKCKYCCTIACWFCWGTTHFCEPCHQIAGNNVTKECEGQDKCPLKGMHPPNGEEYPLGCGLCRNEYLEEGQNQNTI